MYKHLELEEEDIVDIKYTNFEKGKMVKLQPVTSNFLDITNPKAVLENSLRNFSCLTIKDRIAIYYNNDVYEMDVLDVKPKNSSGAIKILDVDLNVEFAPPLDYVEPQALPKKSTINKADLQEIMKHIENETYYVSEDGRIGVPNLNFTPNRLHFCRKFTKHDLSK
ncbi:MAG: hypothetical protein MHPSP_004524, partial [Paramarteilia canceri]